MIKAAELNGIQLVCATLVRPKDVRENKYLLAATMPKAAVNLNEPRMLVGSDFDCRPKVYYQGGQGSCAACSSAKATEAARNSARRLKNQVMDAQAINPGPLYAKARMKRGDFPLDTGSYIADNLDELLLGAPLLSQSAYRDDPSFDYATSVWDASADYEQSHRPFYPSEGMILERIWQALDAGLSVVAGSYWPDAWFQPKGGKLDASVTQYGTGGHATYIWGIVPGFVLFANSWSERWSTDAPTFGNHMRPGDFAVAFDLFTRQNSPFWEFRAVSPEPVIVVEPKPQPEPKPEPSPSPSITKDKVLTIANSVVSQYEQAVSTATSPYYKSKTKFQREGARAVRDRLDKGL